MDNKAEDKREEHAEHGVPHPPPHEEEAMGLPNSDRLQSEVPQSGENSSGGSKGGEDGK